MKRWRRCQCGKRFKGVTVWCPACYVVVFDRTLAAIREGRES